MKICILGLEGAAPEVLFHDERLANLRRVMEVGAYGALQNVIPPGAVPGSMCLAASQDPGALGVYGFLNRPDYSYSASVPVSSAAAHGSALWDQMATAGKKSIVFAVPPNFPPRPIIFMGPNPAAADLALPAAMQEDVRKLAGQYAAADTNAAASRNKDELREQIFSMSRTQWDVVRWLLGEQEWDCFHVVDIALNRVQRAFWEYSDPQHRRYRPGSPYQAVIADYYLWLDEQIGSVLELLDGETLLLLASSGGEQRLDGGFAINQWLSQEGLLVLQQASTPGLHPLHQLNVNWAKTWAWSGDGPFAPIYFNVKGREPQGIIPANGYEEFREQITTKLENLCDSQGRPLGVRVFQPKQVYREIRNITPDLMVELGEGRWSSVGSVGHSSLYLEQMGDGCQPGGGGAFLLAAPNCPLSGVVEGAHLLDMAPTLLDLAGYDVPASMQGRSLVAGMDKSSRGPDNDQIILDRLAGLGYV